ncbi:hypothetical protein HBI81_103420 [Parastagonospora nodorum]|nr:hypothetical protein HBH51_061690 [Parastagonospora nodorum]KAH4224604.1 hypothetical protein HBI06_118410 [Parastagonospora nodorum]KAH4246958.1 hypothetical protein HBI05_038790 [Parastagonospora nodorum]KAH4263830.1 hypothetical protein HBI03_099370 [Parastagonospora nodorum]KAH5078443.1 hypothetical protein HBH95_095110 [Parastagonospora nodorum]
MVLDTYCSFIMVFCSPYRGHSSSKTKLLRIQCPPTPPTIMRLLSHLKKTAFLLPKISLADSPPSITTIAEGYNLIAKMPLDSPWLLYPGDPRFNGFENGSSALLLTISPEEFEYRKEAKGVGLSWEDMRAQSECTIEELQDYP